MHAQTVGLVLSGGGSKGMAHIGAIRALEENGIPINYITGTSMGAIVGGLYAAGYSTEEMESIFLNPDFENIIKGNTDKKHIYHFRQETSNSTWIGFRFDVDSATQFSPTIPVNFVIPAQMDFAFFEIFARVDAVSNRNFDSLFIPFRCIATDIANDKEVVFRTGDLKDAIRASMTFPFYFRPISIENKMLYDGGMMNNFPTDVMFKDFNPDYIIGVAVAKPNKTPSDENLISVLTNMLMNKESYTLKGAPNGIVIYPDVPSLNVTDFKHGKELIQIGYQAVMDSLHIIKQSVFDSIPYCEVIEKRAAFKEKIPDIVIDDIEIRGLNKIQADYIREEMIRPNEILSLKTFKNRYFRLISNDYIAHVYPSLFMDAESKTYKAVLAVTKEKPFKLNIGGYISANAHTTMFLQFKYYFWQHQVIDVNLDAYFGIYYNSLMADFRFTRIKRKPFDHTISIGYSRWNYFSAYRIFVGSETPSYLVHEEAIFNYKIAHLMGYRSRIMGNLTFMAVNDRYYWNNAYTQQDTRDKNQVFLVRPNFVYEYSSIDFKYFATRGFRLRTELSYFAGYELDKPGSTAPNPENSTNFKDWFAFNGEMDKIFRIAKPYGLGVSVHFAWSNLPMFESFNATKLRANHYAPTHESNLVYLPYYRDPVFMAAGISNIFSLYKKLQLRLEGYYYQPVISILRDGTNNAYTKSLFAKRAYIASASLAYATKSGPFSINVSWYSINTPNLMFNLSFGYLLFNNRVF
jgi:NTE family protein